MKSSFWNAWGNAVIEQMWVYSRATEVLVKCIDVELLSDPQALAQYCLHPSEQRLNPLEFHGKRRSAAPAAPASTVRRARGRHQEGNVS